MGERTEVLGPLYYREQKESQHTWAIPPLLSYTRDPEYDLEEFDFVYPILTYDRYGVQHRWQFFQLFSFAGGPSQTESVRNRFTIFPLYFQQRSSDPEQNYTAVVPFYGHMKHRLLRDDVFFVMLPFYLETRKRDVVTRNYVYPLFHVREGQGLRGWQFWPVIGHEHKDITSRTNLFGDLQTVPGHDKRFVLWPIYYDETSGIGSTNQAREQGILPVYALMRSPMRNSTTVLWPFFAHIDDREKQYREWDAPWPLIEFARGAGKNTTRVWPFYGHAASTNLTRDFYLWPVVREQRAHAEPLDRRDTKILFYLYVDNREKNTQTGASRMRRSLWPLFWERRNFNGNHRFQILAPLEPFVPGSHKIERDYSPVWALWRSEWNPTTGASSQSLLWNLYRHDAGPETHKISAFFGLYQSQAGPEGKTKKLFFIPISRSPGSSSSFSPLSS